MDYGKTATHTLIRDLPAADRPRERLRDFGADALSNADLLAIVLRTGTSRESALAQATRLLARFEGLPGLSRASFAELCAERGLGEAKAAQLKSALELGMRLAASAPEERRTLRSPEEVATMLMPEMSLLEQEHVRVALVDTRNRLISIHEVYQGNVSAAQVRVAELLRDAIRANAPAMILVHNHPSGDPLPSAADVRLTEQLYASAKEMGIDVLDHVIIGGGTYVSMRNLRMGFPRDAG
jgi:DNA repair protein RadC